MSRPTKLRKVCSLPEENRFGPLGASSGQRERIIMEIDEYEAVRLIDLEGFTQEECAEQMNISRATVQRIYMKARRKLAESLVNGKVLIIEGGEYQLCDNLGDSCGRGCNRNRRRGRRGNSK